MALGLQLALVFLTGIGGGILTGELVDRSFNSRPFGLLIGVFCGVGVSFWLVYRFLETKK